MREFTPQFKPDLLEMGRLVDEVARMVGAWEDRPHDISELSEDQLKAMKSTLNQVKKNMLDLNMITGK